ncbi:MAG: HEAT repeat domain-containing protein [Bacteroidota bacterium]
MRASQFCRERRLPITDWLWGTFAPAELRVHQGDRLFGCGECLRACPRNKVVRPRTKPPARLEGKTDQPELIPLATADESYYRRVMPSFARQAGVENLRANVLVALGNLGDPAAVPALSETLHWPQGRIRAYSAWALGRIGGAEARSSLARALREESDPAVAGEIDRALSGT